ncbi:WD40 repeat-like protein [Coemansia reversa NRRL 1564]|uniref:WD40 repeat-like protein n=1 Tax=Coemansia reversa (strain ATCC 12441 / NRRL 1564) TaxID=763665 RepID=A0A2G5BAI7_COERN|nr:WD40 repeat-like protein [Coemansia reversa NRRL 1564]|eukprot:PIA16023.1 WD40 repeat-like protein [Coemansia reversa NRRL 1564]
MVARLVSRYNQGSVTAVAFVEDTIVLSASGGTLALHSVDSQQLIDQIKVFEYARIHGVSVQEEPAGYKQGRQEDWVRVLVYGSKSWAIVIVNCRESACKRIRVESVHTAEDWIKAAHWVRDRETDGQLVALATAHNQVIIADAEKGICVHRVSCEERSILYAAAFYGQFTDELLVAAGTVFNQVLLWSVGLQDSNNIPVQQRLCGHEGVIFGLSFSKDGQLLASVSDDRSLRIWNLHKQQEQSVATVFGHQARIWQSVFLDQFVVTASEDGTCRVWERQTMEAADVWTQCAKNVWSVAANRAQSLVAAGGGDGSVVVWSLDAVRGKRVEQESQLDVTHLPPQLEYNSGVPRVSESIRGFALIAWNQALLTTDSGHIMHCTWSQQHSKSWSSVLNDFKLVGYSMVASAFDGSLVAIGLRDGSVILLAPHLPSPINMQAAQITSSAVRTLIVLSSGVSELFELITVDTSGQVLWSRVTICGSGIRWNAVAVLDVPQGRGLSVTAAVNQTLGWAAIGTTSGCLLVFKLPPLLAELPISAQGPNNTAPVLIPVIQWARAHGRHTLTAVVLERSHTQLTNESDSNCTIVTSGRDGQIQRFSVRVVSETQTLNEADNVRCGELSNNKTVIVSRISGERLTEGWVEGLFEREKGQLYAVTFYRKRLELLDLSGTVPLVVLSSISSGASKQWQVLFTPHGIRIGFMRKGHLATYCLSQQLQSSHASRMLVRGISSLDIRTTCALQLNGMMLIASSGEDCHVRLYRYREDDVSNMCLLASERRHSSAVRCAVFVPSLEESDIRYLITAGGGCELRCWRICVSSFYSNPTDSNATMIEWAKVTKSDSADLRIMDIAVIRTDSSTLVAGAYSDGSVRLWRMDKNFHAFKCVARDYAGTHCVLSIAAINIGNERSLLVSGATNGQVSFWDISHFTTRTDDMTCDKQLQPRKVADLHSSLLAVHDVHQSGVNTIYIQRSTENGNVFKGNPVVVMATGGDDGSVVVRIIEIDRTQALMVSEIRHKYAHASSVKGVVLLENEILCSVSTDQRLALWTLPKLNQAPHTQLCLLAMTFTQVADPSTLHLVKRCKKRYSLIVAGIGMEIFDADTD